MYFCVALKPPDQSMAIHPHLCANYPCPYICQGFTQLPPGTLHLHLEICALTICPACGDLGSKLQPTPPPDARPCIIDSTPSARLEVCILPVDLEST
ncbi:hypothetical protein GDO81_017090 [Engystomops pustulosus]|uniref:Uncharacterized protein n=1 Tax=Engystomops pustulosus TaxID=76066 RepID=A0AAV7ABC5_ENGPU|nr:hypothetical protein GDO81_017090 [Engystomops pustulosus]